MDYGHALIADARYRDCAVKSTKLSCEADLQATLSLETRTRRMTMITVIKNKKGLTLDTAPQPHKKYLGEADDLHYIPSSPWIERAVFTEQEEGELKRLCALALAHVPHSDGPEPAVPREPELPVSRKYKVAGDDIKPPQPQFADTRTPSEASKRDTYGTSTDYSTPLTSAGITPGEPVKLFSDSTKRASSSKGPIISNLRFDSWQQAFQRPKANTHPLPTKPLQPVDPRRTVDLRKSSASAPVGAERTLRFVNDSHRGSSASQPNPTMSSDFPRTNRFSHAELNKKLPPLPNTIVKVEDENPKTAPLSRMLKTLGLRKDLHHDDDDCEPLTEPNTALKHTKSTPASPSVGPDGKRKLASKLRIFGRKERPEMPSRGITVS